MGWGERREEGGGDRKRGRGWGEGVVGFFPGLFTHLLLSLLFIINC